MILFHKIEQGFFLIQFFLYFDIPGNIFDKCLVGHPALYLSPRFFAK